MPQISVELKGMEHLKAVIELAGENARTQVPRAAFEVGHEAFADSQRECPVETGALRGSGHVKTPKVSASEIEIEIAYGGPAADYAIYVHEDLDAHHDAPTKAKFLEDPVKKIAPHFGRKLAEAVVAGLH